MNSTNKQTRPAVALYQGDSGREYHEGKRALRPEVLQWVLRLRAAKFQPFVNNTDVVFDYGVGSGWNLGALTCSRKLGYDPADFLRSQVESQGVAFVSDTSELPDGFADVVICHQVLEHILEPAECLRELVRLLKPGSGRLVLHVPWERERRHATFTPNEPNHHLYTWSTQNIGNLLTVLSLKIDQIRIRAYGYDRFAANTAWRFRIGEPGFRFLRACMVLVRPFWEVEAVSRSAERTS